MLISESLGLFCLSRLEMRVFGGRRSSAGQDELPSLGKAAPRIDASRTLAISRLPIAWHAYPSSLIESYVF